MICIIAFVVFGIMGVFSAKYRIVAKEAADCVFRRLTLRKCETGLDKRLKNQISGKIAKNRPKLGKFLYKYFEVFSWLFIILFMASIVNGGIGFYNFIQYGNCNGPENNGSFCIYDPLGSHSQYSGQSISGDFEYELPYEDHDPAIGPENAKVTVIQFGCTSCQYTKKAEEGYLKVIDHFKDKSVRFVFKAFPILSHPDAYNSTIALDCAYHQDKYLDYREKLLKDQNILKDETYFIDVAKKFKLNVDEFKECLYSEKTKEKVDADLLSGKKAQVFGTPTFFINDKKVVGLKTSKKLIEYIDEALEENEN